MVQIYRPQIPEKIPVSTFGDNYQFNLSMKGFTLEFLNAEMETEYCNAKIQRVQKPIYVALIVLGMSYQCEGSIRAYQIGDMNDCRINILMFSIFATQLLISLKFPPTIWINSIISVYLSSLTQFDITSSTTIFDFYLYGASIQLWQACLIILSEFKHSLHQVFITSVIKFAVPLYNDKEGYRYAVGCVICSIIFLLMMYLNNKMARSQYLLTKKELRWQQYMPSIIEKPYFVFEYNEVQQCFLSLEQNLGDLLRFENTFDYTLRRFLRNSQIQNKTLEQYLFQYLKQTHQNEMRLEIVHNSRLMNIKLYDLNIINKQYLLILEPPKLLVQHNKLYLSQIQLYAQFVKNINQYISYELFKTRGQIINDMFQSSILVQCMKITLFELSDFISRRAEIYNKAFEFNIQVLGAASWMKSYRSQLFVFINYLFFILIQRQENQDYKLRIEIKNEDLEAIYVKICIPNKQNFLEAYKRSSVLRHLEQNLLYCPISEDLTLKFIMNIEEKFKNF